ncbi:PAS domain-containing protein [Streptomyces triculaminicus]|uniref:PAS domain-containing protein n=1 Tax=Streptomyces triculaminicus TaxID=2816232 RepID=UPI0033C64EF6
MDRGTSDPAAPGQRGAPLPGRVSLAVVVVDARGVVTHWSGGAGELFGRRGEEAVGRAAADLMPVGGAVGGLTGRAAHDAPPAPGFARSGRARADRGGTGGRVEVLWWAYPLSGPGPERMLVLATDAARLPDGARERAVPAFAPHRGLPGARELAGRLPDVLPGMAEATSGRIVDQVLERGCPVLRLSRA